jgi:poly(3-hydroxybutyrate) depolymerase
LFLQFVGLTEDEFLEIAMSHQVSPYVHEPSKTVPGDLTPDFNFWNRDGLMSKENAKQQVSRWRACNQCNTCDH